MSYIFGVAPGVAAVLADPVSLPVTFSMSGLTPLSRWVGINAAVQSVQVSTDGNYQLTPTLRNFIYFCIFGELPGIMVVNGVCFASDCAQIPGGQMILTTSGINSAMAYYANNAISASGLPIRVGIGLGAFIAFLVHGEFGLVGPDSNLGQFSFQFKTVNY
jgi:hypothetical protein